MKKLDLANRVESTEPGQSEGLGIEQPTVAVIESCLRFAAHTLPILAGIVQLFSDHHLIVPLSSTEVTLRENVLSLPDTV